MVQLHLNCHCYHAVLLHVFVPSVILLSVFRLNVTHRARETNVQYDIKNNKDKEIRRKKSSPPPLFLSLHMILTANQSPAVAKCHYLMEHYVIQNKIIDGSSGACIIKLITAVFYGFS